MPKTIIEERSVTDAEGAEIAHWDFFCLCDSARGDGFLSEGWPTRKLAKARGDQHLAEHESGKPAPEKGELMSPAEAARARTIAEALAAARAGKG